MNGESTTTRKPYAQLDAAVRETRDAEIVRRFAAGETRAAIATDYNLTSERVRQILARAGVVLRPRRP